MELGKKRYARSEVQSIIDDVSRNYEEKLSEQKARIAELLRDNSAFKSELDAYKNQDEQISATLKRAEKYSRELRQKMDMQYSLAVEQIAVFLEKWRAYFDHLSEKYPMYNVVREAVEIKNKLSDIIDKKDAKTVIFTAEKELSAKTLGKAPFNPKEKIADYIAATESNGFNMDEVLNPGALRLEDLCKELGLLTENDL